MNIILFEFYKGTGKDFKNRSIADMLNMSDFQLEKSHDIIQWLFPLKEPSAHNYNAPLLDDETIEAMKDDEACMINLYLAEKRFWEFLIEDGTERPTWIARRNHNFLRLTRVIKCCKMFLPIVAEDFYLLGKRYYEKFPEIIGEETWWYWNDAMQDTINGDI